VLPPVPPPRKVSFDREPKVELVIAGDELCSRIAGIVRCSPAMPGPGLVDAPPVFDVAITSLTSNAALCAVTNGGEVRCKGENRWGQLGAASRAVASDSPVLVAGITSARTVSAGNDHVCALLTSGEVTCWGKNDRGQTGADTHYESDARELVVPTVVPSVGQATRLVVGGDASCVVTAAKTVVCWGMFYPPGNANQHGSYRPFSIPNLADVEDLAGNGSTFCAVSRGRVACWGNLYFLFRNYAHDATLEAIPVGDFRDARRVAVGSSAACALTADGRVWCWGDNRDGQLGRGERLAVEATTPAPLDLPPSVAITLGSFRMGCAITESNDAYCWGRWPRPYDHEDPDGHKAARSWTPVRVPVR
jgi:alpha-tubulin suppressor-like RCC1 family protein